MMNTNSLPQVTEFQYQIALIASHLTLNLLERNEIISFTNYLMDNGYYDDLMLDMIDDNQNLVIDELNDLLKKLFVKLKFIIFDQEQAKYFLTTNFIIPLIQRPFKLPLLYQQYLDNLPNHSIQSLFDKIEPFLDYSRYYGIVIDNPMTDELGYLAYEIEFNIENNVNAHSVIIKFLSQCENWFYRHINTITPIIQRVSLIK